MALHCADGDRGEPQSRRELRVQAIGRQTHQAQGGAPVHYERHHPEQITLYRLIQQHAETFFAEVEAATGASSPGFIKDEFDAFLECGILSRGASCASAAPTAATTSWWRSAASAEGFCPSCGARRTAQTAAPTTSDCRLECRRGHRHAGRCSTRRDFGSTVPAQSAQCLTPREQAAPRAVRGLQRRRDHPCLPVYGPANGPWRQARRRSTGRCRLQKLRRKHQVTCGCRARPGRKPGEQRLNSYPPSMRRRCASRSTARDSAGC